MPGTTITISGPQRNGLYELVRNHLGCRRLRDAGEDLSYRRSPRRLIEVAARRRRLSSCLALGLSTKES